MAIDISAPSSLSVIKGASLPVDVIGAWDSGNGPYNIVIITDEPQPGNIYRFNGQGESTDPNVTLQSDADFEWRAVLPYLPRFVLRTTNAGVLQMRAFYADGTIDNRALNAPPAASGLGAAWPASLQPRRMVLFDFDAALRIT